MMHAGVEVSEAPSPEAGHFRDVELISHTYFQGAGKDGYVLPVGMSMRGDPVTVRHLEANREVAGRGHWVAFENGDLRTRRQKRWRRPEFDLIRHESILATGRMAGEQRRNYDENEY